MVVWRVGSGRGYDSDKWPLVGALYASLPSPLLFVQVWGKVVGTMYIYIHICIGMAIGRAT